MCDAQFLFSKRLSNDTAINMIRDIHDEEIKEKMFGIGEGKAPGPDGFTSIFFKSAWEGVGPDVCIAVKEFFANGKMLRELNNTIISLIPKISTPIKVTDYRPISCCNVLYKCISKIITNRMKFGVNTIVSDNQSAFVPGRSISDNILLSQELVKNYHLLNGSPTCAFKLDIQKAYDTVN